MGAAITVSIEWRPFGVAVGYRELPDKVGLTIRELTSVLFGTHLDHPVPVPESLAWLPRSYVPSPVLERSQR